MTDQSRQDDHRKHAVVYLRVASADPQDQHDGIARQRAICAREADRLGAVITAEFVDVGASGNNPNRPGLRALLKRIAAGPIKYILAQDHARLARNHADYRAITTSFRQAGVRLVAVDNGVGMTVDELLRSMR